MEHCPSEGDKSGDDEKVNELSKIKRTKKLVVRFDILGDLILRHGIILTYLR